MGSLQLRFPSPAPRILSPKKPKAPLSGIIRCGLRGGPRRPLWRGRVLSTEAIHAVHALKLAKSSPKPRRSSSPNTKSHSRMEVVFRDKLGRLLKADQIAVLTELRRQNEWEMTLQEVWYKPDLSLYSDMIFMVAKNKLIEIAEQLFSELKEEGLQPDTRAYTEMIGAFLQVGMVEKAMDMYKLMKESGCNPDKLTLTILIRNLEKAGEKDLASAVRKECAEYVDFPDKFLEEVDKKFLYVVAFVKTI
ncbi:protein THYLAKOID ASSEMBLY 8-like, chloroplastic [Cocos nucifera]|nr:protein THYLAKOID ASSEMBLY 8-like, chloroplastic [Cocos nucifera]